jgi:hypothetical protein
MRVTIDASPGEVALSVEEAVRAVAAASVSDGGREDDIRERIAKAVGADRLSVEVREKSDWAVLIDAEKQALDLYASTMKLAEKRIVALLKDAAAKADTSRYLSKLGS